jgi:hypothetical protein
MLPPSTIWISVAPPSKSCGPESSDARGERSAVHRIFAVARRGRVTRLAWLRWC